MQSARHYALVLGFVALAAPLDAQELPEAAQIHGFGSWAYGRSGVNEFLHATPEGDYHHALMALNVSKSVNSRLSIHSQLEVFQGHVGSEAEIDFAFADYKLTDHLSLRAGQVKHPFGIYTEIFHVGTLRPFIDLPQGFYGPVGFVGESYRGIGLSGSRDLGSWSVVYDAYAGGNELEKSTVPEQFYLDSTRDYAPEENEHQSTRDMLGGRIVLQTPIRGFTFGASAYTGVLDGPTSNRRAVLAGQFGYRSNTLTLEGEIAHENQPLSEHTTGGYVLGAYRITPEWQVATQFDLLRSEFNGVNTSSAPSLQDHRETAVAISRWVSRALVIKTEYHHVNGNRFAVPEHLAATVAAGELRVTAHVFKFGAQFAF